MVRVREEKGHFFVDVGLVDCWVWCHGIPGLGISEVLEMSLQQDLVEESLEGRQEKCVKHPSGCNSKVSVDLTIWWSLFGGCGGGGGT